VARFAPLYDVPILEATADVRGTFRNTAKYGIDDAPPYFEEVDVQLEIESRAPSGQVAQLISHAERACHAAQTLRHGVVVKLDARLNGEVLPDGLLC
jgi:organic hydroperoxide reductase OsmC/OhrA